MKILSYNRKKFVYSTYATDIKKIFPINNYSRDHFFSALVAVKPGQKSLLHMHHDSEIFIIFEGTGRIISKERKEIVKKGDVIYLPPYTEHALENTAKNADLIYLTCWWENKLLCFDKKNERKKKVKKEMYVVSASPTPNGDLHLGHLAGPYLAADIYKRYQIHLKHTAVYHLCSIDENQSYPDYLARLENMPLNAIITNYSDMIKESLVLTGIHCDSFIKPSETPICKAITQKLFHKLYYEGALTEKNSEALFCENCDIFLHEAFVAGTCPYCKAPASGGGCESCHLFYEESDLLSAYCKYCQAQPLRKNITRWYFKLSPYKEYLLEFHNHPDTHPLARTYVSKILATNLPEIPLTHMGEWGSKIKDPNGKNVSIYSYFELPARYIASKMALKTNNNRSRIIQFLGVDNRFWRLILFPILLLKLNRKDMLQHSIINEFYELDNKKFSTSRKHVISIKDLLKKYHSDLIRLYICYTRPETVRSNFSLTELDNFYTSTIDLKWNYLINILNSALMELKTVPSPGLWTVTQEKFLERLKTQKQYIESCYEIEVFSLKSVTKCLCILIEETCDFMQIEKILGNDELCKSYYRTTVALGLLAFKLIAYLACPIMPNFAETILKQFDADMENDQFEVLEWVTNVTTIPMIGFTFRKSHGY